LVSLVATPLLDTVLKETIHSIMFQLMVSTSAQLVDVMNAQHQLMELVIIIVIMIKLFKLLMLEEVYLKLIHSNWILMPLPELRNGLKHSMIKDLSQHPALGQAKRIDQLTVESFSSCRLLPIRLTN
jgi:hypothetical protein